MRLTLQLIRSRAKGPLQNLEYLDLSNLELVAIEKLNTCPRLHTLLLQDNNINDVSNLDVCANLWNLDLSNNALKSLDGLSRFVAFGSVVLSNNDLSWHELGKIRHIHIISLSLHGNQQLEKDPYYRIHVIDCLPNLWMLDGRIITSAERQQVKHFFQDSALTDHPVRHKLAKEWFIPSNLKKLDVNGIFGQKATHMMRRFPTNAVHNIETDKKRLMYIAYTFQENIVIENKYNKMDLQILKYNPCFLEDLLEVRPKDVERCNMLLLLLVASLEFVLPTHLVKETLDTTKLSKVGKVYSMDLFLLPRDIRCSVLCVLLAAVKIDKDNREEGGLYDKLYLCLFYTVAELIKLSQSQNNKQAAIRSKLNTVYSDYKCLLASELVQLLCIVPAFFEYVNRDVGVMNLVVTATGDTMIVDKVKRIAANIVEEGGELKKLYEETADFLLQKVQEQTMNLANRTAKIQISDEVLNQKRAFPMRPALSAVDISEYHSRGISSPNKDPPRVLSAKKMSDRQRKRFPHLGDILLLGPQTLGKIVSLPQPFVALVSMDAVPVASGAMECKLKQSDDHFTYVNMDQLLFDLELGLWKPKGSIGDSLLKEYQNNHKLPKPRLTMQNLEDLKKELERKASTADQTPRPNSPEWTRPLTAQESSPLVYSSQRPKTAVEFSTAPKDGLDTPRPMSSLLKEKLDLKLEMIQRKTIDIDVDKALNQSSPSPETPRLNESKSQTDQSTDSHVKGEGHQLECVHCAMEAARARQQQQEEEEEKNMIPKQDIVENEDNKENTLEKEDQSAQEPFHMPVSISGTHIELQIPGQNDGSSTARSVTKSPTRTVSSARRPASSRRSTPSFGPFSGKTKKLSPRTRPFSAVDAYKYIVAHPIRPSLSQENTYNSSYQTQRMEAWKQSVQDKAAQNKEVKDETIVNEKIIIKGEITPVSIKTEERQKSPPPQRPCSPAARGQLPPSANRPGSAVLNLSDGNRWLAGGRDLYWESVTKRPKSGHVPGWKDGLPDSMTRPKSAVAARAFRRSRTATPVTPSSLMYETLLQGYHAGDYSLPELTDLSDYQKTPHAYLTRALGLPQHNSGEDFFIPPSPSAVYRWG